MTEASQLGPSDDATVVLDIGGDVGALILQTGPDLLLAEIEISRVDGGLPLATDAEQAGSDHGHDHDHGHEHDEHGGHTHPHSHAPADGSGIRTHVAVRERRTPDGVRYAAIYPDLREGEYTIWRPDGTTAEVTVTGGQITELDWR